MQVSSGVGSPTKFVLNNTGENVSFTVQAYGNGGSAPLTSAPTCGATLPQSTGGGFGSSSSSSSPSATFQTQGVNNASQTTLNIESVDSSIKVSNPSGGNVAISGLIQVAVTLLGTSQLTSLTTTPIVIVPAPAAGKILMPVALLMEYIYGGTAFGATGTFTFFYGSTNSSNFAFAPRNGQNFLDQTSSQFVSVLPSTSTTNVGAPKSVADGSSISVGNDAAAFNTGNGSVRVTVLYYVADSV